MGVNDAAEMLEVAKAENVRLETAMAERAALANEYASQLVTLRRNTASAYADRDAALERLGVVLAERDQLARLHEVATERVVAAAAVIRLAKDVATGLSADANTYKTGRLLWDLLASADTDAALRERDAEKWAEGFDKCAHWWEIHHFQQVRNEANPYREGAKTDG